MFFACVQIMLRWLIALLRVCPPFWMEGRPGEWGWCLVLAMEKGFDQGKNSISLFFVESPDFFHGSPDFPLPGVGRSATFCYVFNISLYCNDTIPSLIGNLWRVLLLGSHLKPGSDAVLHMSRIEFNELSSCEVRRLNQFETADIIRIGLAVLHAWLSRE